MKVLGWGGPWSFLSTPRSSIQPKDKLINIMAVDVFEYNSMFANTTKHRSEIRFRLPQPNVTKRKTEKLNAAENKKLPIATPFLALQRHLRRTGSNPFVVRCTIISQCRYRP